MAALVFFISIFCNFPLAKLIYELLEQNKKRAESKESLKDLFELSDFIDFLLLSLLAGNTLPQAFFAASRGLQKSKASFIAQSVIHKMQVGCSFSESLQLTRMSLTQTYAEFVDAMLIATRMGTDISTTLQNMAHNLRQAAATLVEAEAARAPIRMLFPLVVFILPVIFILLGAGPISDLIENFSDF